MPLRPHSLVLVVVATVLLAACSRDPAKASRRYLESGDRYSKSGQFKEAAIEYRNAIKQTPQSVEAHAKLADVSGRANDRETAIRETLQVAELDPGDVSAQVRAGTVFLLAGRFTDARDRAEAALRVDRTAAPAHILLGEALAGLHDSTRSEASLREAVRIAPASADAHVALGSYEWSAGRPTEAERELRKA